MTAQDTSSLQSRPYATYSESQSALLGLSHTHCTQSMGHSPSSTQGVPLSLCVCQLAALPISWPRLQRIWHSLAMRLAMQLTLIL